jgi:hypothetical protein
MSPFWAGQINPIRQDDKILIQPGGPEVRKSTGNFKFLHGQGWRQPVAMGRRPGRLAAAWPEDMVFSTFITMDSSGGPWTKAVQGPKKLKIFFNRQNRKKPLKIGVFQRRWD